MDDCYKIGKASTVMEIERKFLVKKLPDNLDKCKYHIIEQGYLSSDAPVVRVRRQDDEYYMTYKGAGLMAREEYNLPLTKEVYDHLLTKADGNIIRKKRYLVPIEGTELTVELDIFDKPFSPLIVAEVEFGSIEEAESFELLDWFSEDVTNDNQYHNSNMAKRIIE